MIRENELSQIGRLVKPHGICGEITMLLTKDVDLAELKCIVLKIDGIFVPFFLNSVRPKSSETDLVSIDGVTDEKNAAELCPNDVYAFAEELGEAEDEFSEEGMYASDLQGFEVYVGDVLVGKIKDIDDTTSNYLFIVERPSGDVSLLPVADEFIDMIDPAGRKIVMDLPEGLLDLNDN